MIGDGTLAVPDNPGCEQWMLTLQPMNLVEAECSDQIGLSTWRKLRQAPEEEEARRT